MLSARNIENGRIIFDEFRLLGDADFEREHSRTRVQAGDVLITIVGTLGRAAVVPSAFQPFTLQRSVAVLHPERIDPNFLAAQVQAPVVQAWIQANAKGTAQRGIYLGALGGLTVKLPPLIEQRRIVAKLEGLQARSRRARAALDAVPPLLEKLRQSILAAAFRGDLTKDWRAKNKNVEPAEKLLARIRVERRKKWEEAELAKMTAKGKAPKDDGWKGKYKEPEPVDTAGLPELPVGWCWASVEELTSHIIDCLHRTPEYVTDGLPAIRTADLLPGRLLLDGARRVSRETYNEQVSRLVPRTGDVLYSREGARFGLAALVPPGVELCMAQRMMHFRVAPHIAPGYFMWALNSPIGYAQASRDVAGSASPHVNLGAIRRFCLPLPPADEQVAVVSTVDAAWAQTESAERVAVELDGNALPMLDRALLAKAFRGELVPQDPNDEPAEAMLARLGARKDDARAPAPGAKTTAKKRAVRA